MSNSEELAKLIITREAFDKSVEFTIGIMLKDTFHPDFVKELSWILEGQFQKTLQIAQEALNEIYTAQEIDILLAMHRQYPWMAPKAEELMRRVATEAMENGQKAGEMVVKNLEATGDLHRIMQEGFFINEQEEDFGLFNTDEETTDS